MDVCFFKRCSRVGQQRGKLAQRRIEVAAEIFGRRALETKLIGQVMPVLPQVVTKQLYPGGEIVQRGLVGRGGFGPPPCNQIELGKLDLLFLERNQTRSSIKLVDDLEYLLFQL